MTDTRAPAIDQLFAHAAELGIERGYWDVSGRWHDAPVDSVLAVLQALGVPVDAHDASASEAGLDRAIHDLAHHLDARRQSVLEPVVCVVGTTAAGFELTLPADATGAPPSDRVVAEVRLEDGTRVREEHRLDELEVVGSRDVDGTTVVRRRLRVPGHGYPDRAGLPVGAHELSVERGGTRETATLLVAPDEVHQLGARDRLWGVFAPVYALRRDAGIGPDLGGLAELARWIDDRGGKVVATLPLLSSYLDRPCEPSPYSPVSRRFWNEIYLEVERLPELASSPATRAWLDHPDTRSEMACLREAETFDAVDQERLVRAVLTDLAATFFERTSRGAPGFDRWVDEHPLVIDYARFRAVVERRGTGWHDWPVRLRDGHVEADDYDVRVAARHVYAQWSMDRQLADLSDRLGSRGQMLYLDLPVGAGADGFDTWIDRDDYAWGVAVGAPPDEFFAAGQNWGFPPVRPAAARAEGHRHLADCLRHHMAHAGMLRLDHVMGLHRLFLVPDGVDATDGVYVRYPTEEQFAVVAIESVRAGCAVVGEDLGTVPDEVREAMERHRVLRSFVAEFAMPSPGGGLEVPDRHSVASVDTHDTPPLRAFTRGDDIDARRAAGRLSADEAAAARDERARAVAALSAALEARGLGGTDEGVVDGRAADPRLGGLLTVLGESDAPAVLIGVDDLIGESRPQNVPGTGPERPNWVLRLPVDLDGLARDPEVGELLDRLQGARLASHVRSIAAGEG
ncbi:MAG TPA: 4-alpha-glucanotransferase [Acidimicrobiales bacterium]|nr:4-alpha-glucanotransferase [Acidimicrobiales bacterium]